jgi:hypothetical protein
MATITIANSVFTLTATAVFPVPQALQGYAADDAFTTEAIAMADVVIGVDGKLSAGYTPNGTDKADLIAGYARIFNDALSA